MKRVVEGILAFQKGLSAADRRRLIELARHQNPKLAMIACSDSRVQPNVFASTNPGDIFVTRNVGNLVPCCRPGARRGAPRAVGAMLEYAVLELQVKDIVICGHSECGAMKGAMRRFDWNKKPNLAHWLEQVRPTITRLHDDPSFAKALSEHNRLSQMSVIVQLENLLTYPMVADRVVRGDLRLHGWWFNLRKWDVSYLDDDRRKFRPIDSAYLKKQTF